MSRNGAENSFVLSGGTVVQPRIGTYAADVVVSDGRISAVTSPGEAPSGDRMIDVSGLHIFPGVVDPHVHIGLGNGLAEYESDSGAGAIGGVTTGFYILIDPGSYSTAVREHLEQASTTSHIDFAYHATLMTAEHVTEVPVLAQEHGIKSFKYYMSFRGDEGAYMGVEGTDDGIFYEILQAVSSVDGVLAVHPENIEIVWKLRKYLQESGRDDLAAWHESRPPFVEAEAVRRASFLGSKTNCSLYFVHISSADAADAVRDSRRSFPGHPLYAETCPHYLTHTTSDPIGPLGKVNPPLREEGDLDVLWDSILDGTIDTVGSDHVGRKAEKKQGSIWDASAGFPGMPTILPVLITEGHHQRGLSLEQIAELTAQTPSRIFGVGSRKGDLRPGFDADLAVVDLHSERSVDPAALGTYSDYSLYQDRALKGWPRYTFIRGELAQEDGKLMRESGEGRYIRR